MDQLGDEVVTFIFMKINNQDDIRCFYQVSKKFLKIACIRLVNLHISFLDLLNHVLPASPNLLCFKCSKPLSNTHLKLLAHSCPKLQYLKLDLDLNCSFLNGDMDIECSHLSSTHALEGKPICDVVGSTIEGYFGPDGIIDFNDDGLCAVANACKHLIGVDLRKRVHVYDDGVVSLIRSSKYLAYLDLGGCLNVTDESLKIIGTEGQLRYLSLQGCKQITDFGLRYLPSGNLRYCLGELILAKCDNISDVGAKYLGKLISLGKLDLSWLINLTDISVSRIVESCRTLREIDLTGCENLTRKSLLAFAQHQEAEEIEMFSADDITWEDVEYVVKSCWRLSCLLLNKRIDENPDIIGHMIKGCYIGSNDQRLNSLADDD